MGQARLPVIVGFGGINGAGRASSHHAYRRLVHDALPEAIRTRTLSALARLMGVDAAAAQEEYLLAHTLIRRVEPQHFNPDAVGWNQRLTARASSGPLMLRLRRQQLPAVLPAGWQLVPVGSDEVDVTIAEPLDLLLPTVRDFEVKAAGQLPSGFDPGTLYASRNHPRGLQMMIYAASDALQSIGIPWEQIQQRVPADQISVYAGSAMGQLDAAGAGGMLRARHNGQRVTSKFCPLSLAEMPADFVNAYVLGSMGATGATLGACASFLYNLRQGIEDIRSGRARVAFIGSAEAPVNPEVMDGYAAMGALATDKGLRELDGSSTADHRRACRPFAENCGFTIAESAQMVVLFDDALALELGATVYGAATDVFVNADGYKKSISGPGVGNYITMAKAVAAVRAMLGEQALREGGLVQAHGTGTPQNRVTESRILSATARAFGIEGWPVAALKSYLGHSLGSASGDQVNATLGIWADGIIPAINTIETLAEDVCQDGLAFTLRHREVDPARQSYAIINSKGFGGNNASATLLSPAVTARMLQSRHGSGPWRAWERANEFVRERQQDYDDAMIAGTVAPTYRFDFGVLGDADVSIGERDMQVGGYRIDLDLPNPYADMQPGSRSSANSQGESTPRG
ncbi:MAG TPA: beta-ketoacyl synthase [Halieaceae bacterium]|nr:beta-ketoacyl synthase [Halieaceae bacterium]|tara:strand:+ start:4633 stop:6528 length:1896 start_codon:yes stop_codon:yes gene_type:complete